MADRKSVQRRYAAFHEAGHAVARIHVGAPAMAVEIGLAGTGLSHGSGATWTCRSNGQCAVWDRIAVLLAGPVAESRMRKRSLTAILISSGRDDYEDIEQALKLLIGQGFATTESGWERAEAEARGVVLAEWPAINALAIALLERGSLTANEVDAFYSAARECASVCVNEVEVRHG